MQPVTMRKTGEVTTLPRSAARRSQIKSNIPKCRRPQSVRLDSTADLTPRSSLINLADDLPEDPDMASSVHTQIEEPHSISPAERADVVTELRERNRVGSSGCPVLPKAKRIRFFRNGDKFFKGIWYALRVDKMKNMPTLMEDLYRSLGDSTTLTHGIRYIFNIEGTSLITAIEDFQEGGSYVCSSTDQFKSMDYERAHERLPEWKLTSGSRPNPHQETSKLGLNIVGPSTENTDFVYPRIVTLIRNGVKPRKIFRHLLNKKTAKSFDQVMTDLTNLVKLDSGTIRKLYGQSGRRILKLEDFFGEDDVFFAFGASGKAVADDLIVAREEYKNLRRLPNRTRQGGRMPNRNESMQSERSGSVIPEEGGFTLPPELDELFHIVRLMGDGNTALVYEVIDKQTNERKALKYISRENLHGNETLVMSELTLMQRLEHPYVVEMFNFCCIDNCYFISMELVEGGDLFEYLRVKQRVSEQQAARIANCIASALSHIHGLNILHRDLKLENLLVFGGDEEIGVKVADFGLAAELDPENPQMVVCGTPTYVAPEVLQEVGYDEKVDTWATGVIIYAILCGFPPFQSRDETQEDLFGQIQLGRFSFPEPYFDDVSYSARLFIKGLLNVSPLHRWSADEMLTDPWIEHLGNVPIFEETIAHFTFTTTDNEVEEARESNYEYYASRRTSFDDI